MGHYLVETVRVNATWKAGDRAYPASQSTKSIGDRRPGPTASF